MPNNCWNTLVVKGTKDDVDKFYSSHIRDSPFEDGEYIKERILDFNTVIPEPFDARTGEEYNWYGWRCENWGTKWNSYDCLVIYNNHSHTEVSIDFFTAWSPPEPVIKKLIEMYPSLSFCLDYEETGECYAGILEGSNGKITKEDCWVTDGEDEEVEII